MERRSDGATEGRRDRKLINLSVSSSLCFFVSLSLSLFVPSSLRLHVSFSLCLSVFLYSRYEIHGITVENVSDEGVSCWRSASRPAPSLEPHGRRDLFRRARNQDLDAAIARRVSGFQI